MEFPGDIPVTDWLYGIGALCIAAALYVLIRWFVVPLITRPESASPWLKTGLVNRLSALMILAALLVLSRSLDQLQLLSSVWGERVLLVLLAMAVGALLGYLSEVAGDLYERFGLGRTYQIKSYTQLFKILLYSAVALVSFAILTGQSVLYYVSGLGAALAVVLLIFRETILSFIATLQIQASDMVHVGDWIEAPAFGIDGEVVEIALHQVRVQNWDKTISTMPTASLINTPLKNWRGMEQSGGRRIKKAIQVDLSSVRFLQDEEVKKFSRFELLKDYMQAKTQEITEHNSKAKSISYHRRLTNLGTFRAYVLAFLKNHDGIRSDTMTCIVRQLTPGPQGLPLEIYAFTSTTEWAAYENIQSDVFERLLAIMPEFDLRPWQEGLLEGLARQGVPIYQRD